MKKGLVISFVILNIFITLTIFKLFLVTKNTITIISLKENLASYNIENLDSSKEDYKASFVKSSKGYYKALKDSNEVKEKLSEMDKTPTYAELLKMAQDNYGMSEDVFKVAFGWAVNEGYDGAKNLRGEVDTYLGYLCDCVGINLYMGYDLKTADALARKIAGGDKSSTYYASSLINKANRAINNPNAYAPQFKGMYLALRYPDENAHDCYGPSVADQNYYRSRGGVLYYQGGAYRWAPNYPIQIWTLWYDGIKHWVGDVEEENKGSGTIHPNVDPEWHFTPSTPSQNYDQACSIKGTREAVSFIGRMIVIACYIIPLIIIVLGMIDFGKAVTSNDEKAIHKATSTLIKRIVAGVVVFVIPIILKSLLNVVHINDLVNDSDTYDSCLACLFSPFECADSMNDE